jgi:hypothetical protein
MPGASGITASTLARNQACNKQIPPATIWKMTERLTRISLWLAFAFNLLAAAVFAIPGSTLGQWLGLPASASPVYTALVSFFVALFGCAYA